MTRFWAAQDCSKIKYKLQTVKLIRWTSMKIMSFKSQLPIHLKQGSYDHLSLGLKKSSKVQSCQNSTSPWFLKPSINYKLVEKYSNSSRKMNTVLKNSCWGSQSRTVRTNQTFCPIYRCHKILKVLSSLKNLIRLIRPIRNNIFKNSRPK